MWGNPIIFSNSIDDKITEFVRIAYVAFSRARNGLYIYLKNDLFEISGLLKKLDNYCKQKNLSEHFYEVIDLNNY